MATTRIKVAAKFSITAEYTQISERTFDLLVPPGEDPVEYLERSAAQEIRRMRNHAVQFEDVRALSAPKAEKEVSAEDSPF